MNTIAQARGSVYTELLESLSDFQDYEQGWVIFPERNGTLFMQNEQHDAGINIGYKDFS